MQDQLHYTEKQKPLIRRTSQGMEYDVNQAIRNLKNVTLIARTEYFNDDVKYFSEILSHYGIRFEFFKIKPLNVSSNINYNSINESLEHLQNALSDENYKKLCKANAQDLFLFDFVKKLIDSRLEKPTIEWFIS